MDMALYGLLKGDIDEAMDNVTLAYAYKGSVDSVSDLPDNAALGDLYTVDGSQYVWDGEAWVLPYGTAITDAQIRALFE